MARIPTAEIERLKLDVSLVRLVEAAGIALKPHGKDRIGRCPFHDDKTPSLVISPKSNLWHCLGACQAGGSVVDWVMRWEGVSFRRAVELLRKDLGIAPSLEPAGCASTGTGGIACDQPDVRPAEEVVSDVDDQALLRQVIDYYHATLKQSPEALAYLAKRGLTHPELIEHFQLGYANRTLGYQLPARQRVARERLQAQLERIGIYRSSGHEHLNGSLIVPVITLAGDIAEVYGRKIGVRLREGTPLHLYLPGPHRGVFNEQGLVGQEEIILCEALIDALTFWCAGYRNVTSSYGIEGFTDEHVAAFQRHGVKRVLIAYDADAAGDSAAGKLATRLMSEGFDCYRCRFPKGSDANQYALDVTPAPKSLGLVIRQAEWLGNGAAPTRDVHEPHIDVPSLVAELEAAKAEIPTDLVLPEPPAYRVPPSAPATAAAVSDRGELTLTLGERIYRVRGIDKNLSYEQLKVWIKASCADFVHVDTIELYQAKQRAVWIKQASVELGVSEEIVKADLGKLLRAVEQRQEAVIQERLQPAAAALTPALTPAQHDAALALLRDPQLIERIGADVEAIGVVGEGANALVAYLACVSRKLDKPLAVLIQSTSAAGKSTLMDALLALMPESERVHYSAMTGQSLFYLGEQSMKHKILAIAEEEGVRQAGYALKVLQSQGELTIASTGKDPATGQLVTQTYRVEGPVMLFLTTTAIDVDEELLNRCLVLTINESREQTAAIQTRQRASRTLAGLLTKARSDEVLATHRAAQQLLRPLAVVNPFAERLTFASDRVRTRRDHQKYLALIDAIALLHQYQRPIRTAPHGSRTIEYVEVTAGDITLANGLAHEVLGRSLDELPPQTRRLLGQIVAYVEAQCQVQALERSVLRFTRRELREATHWGDTQLKVHLARLEDHEYLVVHRRGLRHEYELAFDGKLEDAGRQLIGLCDLDGVATTRDRSVSTADRSGSGRPSVGVMSGDGRSASTAFSASAGAVLPSLVAASEETAPQPEPHGRRRNGTSYAAQGSASAAGAGCAGAAPAARRN
jgi:DNA primase